MTLTPEMKGKFSGVDVSDICALPNMPAVPVIWKTMQEKCAF